jgi:hypothetical protein
MSTEELAPSLLAALARVPDVRSRHGWRSPAPALLTVASAAMLSGAHSLTPLARGDFTVLLTARGNTQVQTIRMTSARVNRGGCWTRSK